MSLCYCFTRSCKPTKCAQLSSQHVRARGPRALLLSLATEASPSCHSHPPAGSVQNNGLHSIDGIAVGHRIGWGGAWGWFLWLPADHHGGFALGGALAWSRCPAIPRAAELGCGAATPLASCQRGWLYTTLPPKGCCSCLSSSSTSQSCLSKHAQRLIPLVCLLEKVCNGV